MVKTPQVSFTNDEVREAILKFLYEKWKNPRGMDSAKQTITEIKKALKSKGMEQGEVIRNLQYLIDTKWVEEIVKEVHYFTGKFTTTTEKKSYMVTSQGIQFFEGRSRFDKKEGIAGIRIENVSGIVTIGNNNYARTEFVPLFKSLDELKNRMGITDELDDATKLDCRAEVNTIQSQLSKPNPDKNIISTSWDRIKEMVPIASIANSITNITPQILQIIGSG